MRINYVHNLIDYACRDCRGNEKAEKSDLIHMLANFLTLSHVGFIPCKSWNSPQRLAPQRQIPQITLPEGPGLLLQLQCNISHTLLCWRILQP